MKIKLNRFNLLIVVCSFQVGYNFDEKDKYDFFACSSCIAARDFPCTAGRACKDPLTNFKQFISIKKEKT